MQRLQDKKAQGGIRYGPENVWHADGCSAILIWKSILKITSSAYATFRLLAAVTGTIPEYAQSADRILQNG